VDQPDAMTNPCAFSSAPRSQRAEARFLVEKFAPDATIIDVGFGQGYFLDAAREAGRTGIGVDRDAGLVQAALNRGLAAHCADVRDLPALLPERADGFVAQHLVEHLTPSEARSLLADLARLVRPGGTGLLVTPNYRDWRVASEWFWHDPTHVRPYTAGTVRELLSADEWRLVDEGLMPETVDRHTPTVWLGRLRHGRHYGRSGRWMQLHRV